MSSFSEYYSGWKKKNNNNTTTNKDNSWDSFSDYYSDWKKKKEENDILESKKEEEDKKQQITQESNKEKKEDNKESILEELKKNTSMSPTEQMKIKEKYDNLSLAEKNKIREATMPQEVLGSEPSELYDIKYLDAELNPDKYFIKPSVAFKDGYQVGDVTKTVGSTLGDIGTNFVKGVVGVGQGVGKFLASGVAQVADWTGNDEYANKVRKKIADNPTPTTGWIEENIEKPLDKNSISGNINDQLVENIGQMAGYWAGGEVAGGIAGSTGMATEKAAKIGQIVSDATMFTSSAGDSFSESYSKENVKDWQAWTKAIGSGGIEVTTERLFGLFGTSGIDTDIANIVSNRISSGIGKVFARNGIQATGESVEEFLSYLGNQGLDRLIDSIDKVSGGNGAKFHKDWNWEDVGKQMGMAFLSSNLIGGGMNIKSVMENKTNSNTWKDAINQTAKIQDTNGQIENLKNEMTKINEEISKETDINKINDLKKEYEWKQKQLEALTIPDTKANLNQQDIENTQNPLYNNNESESGINGQREDLGGDIGESRLFEKRKQNEIKYREWEQSIKSKEESEFTNEEREINDYLKNNFNKTIKYIKEDNSKGWNAGASLDNKDIVYINTEKANEYGLKRTALHETMESNIRFSNENNKDIILSAMNDIVNLDDFKKQKENFWKDQDGEIPSDYAIAKDIVCDRFAEMNGEKLDYEILDSIKDRIDASIEYFNKENSNESSFNLPKNLNNEVGNYEMKTLEDVLNETPEEKQNIMKYLDRKRINYETDENNNIISVENEEEIKNYYKEKQETKDLSPKNIEENSTPKKLTRKMVREQILQEMNITDSDLQAGEDINAINYQLTDPIRVNEKVFGREIGKKINDLTINKTKHNTAEKIRWQNKERAEISELGIKPRSKESAAVQKYGERQYVDEYGDTREYGDVELATEFPNKKTQEKIKHAAQVIRSKYDSYIEQTNNVLTALGYDAIPKRKDYMRHFQELGDMFSKSGVPFNLNDMSAEDLPTDINGLTEFNKPGKNWFAQAQKRYGKMTTYDAITGIDGYLEGVGNLIFHTQDIQNYRAVTSLIRDTFGEKKGFENLDNLTNEEAAKRIKDIQNNKLSKYVAWLDEQANSLAGKKGAIDRGVERFLGRRAYTFFNTIKQQVGSNMTGLNVRSSLTNLISSTIASAKTNKIALVKGTVSTIGNMLKNDDFINKSDFLTSRFGSDSLSSKTWQKISNAGQIFMTGTDYFTSNIIVRSKYYEALQKGMTENEAISYADDFASRVMGDRSQGATAEAFNSKTLGLFTQFQLEVNNQWQYMIHDTKMDFQQNSEISGGLKAGATALFQLGQIAAYSYFFNEIFEKLTGSRAAFDPIEILKTLFGLDDDKEENKTFSQRLSEAGEMLVDNIPFGNLITGGGRIPISEAFTGVSTLGKKLTNQKDKYGNDITWEDVGKDMMEALPYWVLPTGYGQAKKTINGMSMYSNKLPTAGSYTDSGNLRYTVDDNVGSKIQAGLFGTWANPYAQDYVKSGYKTIDKKNIDEMVGLDMNSTEYRKFKYGLSKTGSKKEDKLNYINASDLTPSQKNLVANNLNKDSKTKIDMKDYGNYNSYEEYKYATEKPEKYSVISQIDSYDNYQSYKKQIANIKETYSSDNGYTSAQRKSAVQNYIDSLNLDVPQKMMLEKEAGGYSIKNYSSYIQEYLDSTNLTESEKYYIWEELFN